MKPLPVLSAPQTVRRSLHPGITVERGREWAMRLEQQEEARRLAAPMTCADCRHIGRQYLKPYHRCGKEAERRKASMPPDADFLDHFRAFFDASPKWAACAWFEPSAPKETKNAG